MTWNELAEKIATLTANEREQEVTFYSSDQEELFCLQEEDLCYDPFVNGDEPFMKIEFIELEED